MICSTVIQGYLAPISSNWLFDFPDFTKNWVARPPHKPGTAFFAFWINRHGPLFIFFVEIDQPDRSKWEVILLGGIGFFMNMQLNTGSPRSMPVLHHWEWARVGKFVALARKTCF